MTSAEIARWRTCAPLLPDGGREAVELLLLALEDTQTLEQFWKRAAEQALRLWDRAQNEYDNLLEELDSCRSLEDVRALIKRTA